MPEGEVEDGPKRDDFIPLNCTNKDAEFFIRQSLDPYQFCITDRISFKQFISLFSVSGPQNAERLDKLTKVLKSKAKEMNAESALKEKLKHRKGKRSSMSKDLEDAEELQKKKKEAEAKETYD